MVWFVRQDRRFHPIRFGIVFGLEKLPRLSRNEPLNPAPPNTIRRKEKNYEKGGSVLFFTSSRFNHLKTCSKRLDTAAKPSVSTGNLDKFKSQSYSCTSAKSLSICFLLVSSATILSRCLSTCRLESRRAS